MYQNGWRNVTFWQNWNWIKNKFYRNKIPICLKDVAIKKVLESNRISLGEKDYKYVNGKLYNYNKIKPLHIMLPKIIKKIM